MKGQDVMTIEENATTLKVLLAIAKVQPEKAPMLWQAARIVMNMPASKMPKEAAYSDSIELETKTKSSENALNENQKKPETAFLPLQAEFDYEDENGLHTHRTVILIAMTDGRDIKRNRAVPIADRYGYLLTGYCTLRKQIRSFRSSRISNLRTFTEGEAKEPNRQWRQAVAS